MTGRLDGKAVFISGTSSGIGRAAALVFAAEGAQVFGCGRDETRARETVELVREAGGVMESLAPVDLTTADGAQAWIDSGIKAFGGIDVLYNNASALVHPPPGELPLEEWYFTIDHELHLPYLCTQAAWPHLRVSGGVIINTGSVAGLRGVSFQPMLPHGVTKAGCLSMTRHLAAAGAPYGIRAVSISPGMIRTPETARFMQGPDNRIAGLVTQTPSGRVGEPEEVAKLAAFLASDDASYINGANIVIDGGVSAMGG